MSQISQESPGNGEGKIRRGMVAHRRCSLSEPPKLSILDYCFSAQMIEEAVTIYMAGLIVYNEESFTIPCVPLLEEQFSFARLFT